MGVKCLPKTMAGFSSQKNIATLRKTPRVEVSDFVLNI